MSTNSSRDDTNTNKNNKNSPLGDYHVTPSPEWDLLLSASQKNRPDLIRDMVRDGGVDPSHANAVGQSALHIAALWGHGAFCACVCVVQCSEFVSRSAPSLVFCLC
jgi:ankyrin repeat protein